MKDKKVRNRLQHSFNPLHVFCRLRKAGMNPELARKLCSAYERSIYRRVLS